MICDLCDKDQQNICERTFHFIKPINECLMRKAQENRQIIDELEKIRQEIYDIEEPDHDFEGFYYCFEEALKIIDKELAEMKGENK